MSTAAEMLLKGALELPFAEREMIANALYESFGEPSSVSPDPELLAELESRSAAIDAGTAEFAPWSEVRRRVHEKLGM